MRRTDLHCTAAPVAAERSGVREHGPLVHTRLITAVHPRIGRPARHTEPEPSFPIETSFVRRTESLPAPLLITRLLPSRLPQTTETPRGDGRNRTQPPPPLARVSAAAGAVGSAAALAAMSGQGQERKTIDLEDGWAFMEKGISKLINILERRPEPQFNSEDYMMLYT